MTTTGSRGNTSTRQLDAKLTSEQLQHLRRLAARDGRRATAKRLGIGVTMLDKLEGGGATTQAAIDRLSLVLTNCAEQRVASVDSAHPVQNNDRQAEAREQGRRCALVRIPYWLRSSANLRENRFDKARRVEMERALGRMHLSGLLLTKGITSRFADGKNASKARLWFPVVVTLTRVARVRLDAHDNLKSAFKHIVDGIADAMGTRDDDERITWLYAQQPGEHEIRIEVVSA